MQTPSSQILLRVHRQLHLQLLARSKSLGQSLNEHCIDKLRIPSSLGSQLSCVRNVLEQADILLGTHLLGLVLYGSRARGDAHSGSDWDFLLVVDQTKSLNRQLYRWWEEHTSDRLPSEVEVNFVHLPDSLCIATGFWGEIALDGVVIYEENFTVSQHLNRVRRSMADGRILRRTVHGQSYWVYEELA